MTFVSYVFHLKQQGGTPIFQDGEPISAFYSAWCRPRRVGGDCRGGTCAAYNGDRRAVGDSGGRWPMTWYTTSIEQQCREKSIC